MIPFPSIAMPGQAASPPTSGKSNSSGVAFEAIVASMLPAGEETSLQPGLPGAQGAETTEDTAPENSANEILVEAPLETGVANQLPALQGLGMFTAPAPTGENLDVPAAAPGAVQQQAVPGLPSGGASLAPLVSTAPHAEQAVAGHGNANANAEASAGPGQPGLHAPAQGGALGTNQVPVALPGRETAPTPGTIQPSASKPIPETSTAPLQRSVAGAVAGENPDALSLPNGFRAPVATANAVHASVSGPATGEARAVPGTIQVTAAATQLLTDPGVSPETKVPSSSGMAPANETSAMLTSRAADPENALAAPPHGSPLTPTGAATPEASPTSKLGIDALSGGKTLAVESAVSRGAQELPLNRQLSGPIAALATGPHGDRTLSINIAPEALGPVTVKAHLGPDGLRVELTAPTEAGRDALRAMLPELRRDLAATGAGTVNIGTATENGSSSGGGNPGAATDQRFAAPGSTHQSRALNRGDAPVEGTGAATGAATQHANHLDVMA